MSPADEMFAVGSAAEYWESQAAICRKGAAAVRAMSDGGKPVVSREARERMAKGQDSLAERYEAYAAYVRAESGKGVRHG
jgi:hypothetical protein